MAGRRVLQSLISECLQMNYSISDLVLGNDDDFVDMCYIRLLKRLPDKAGKDGILSAIERGVSRIDIVTSILSSKECSALNLRMSIQEDSSALLSNDHSGCADNMLQSTIEVYSRLLSYTDLSRHQSAIAAIFLAYNIYLSRNPDVGGLASVVSALADDNISIDDLVSGIRFSTEATSSSRSLENIKFEMLPFDEPSARMVVV